MRRPLRQPILSWPCPTPEGASLDSHLPYWPDRTLITLLFLVIAALLISFGQLAAFNIDMSAFPGGAPGVLALVVIVLLVTRRI